MSVNFILFAAQHYTLNLNPPVLSEEKAKWFLYLANKKDEPKSHRNAARAALVIASCAAGRNQIQFDQQKIFTNRVAKASNKRLFYWAQDHNTPV
jgi:hypothetical protein